jgi:hypothetical protein
VRVVPVSWFAPENFVVNSWRLRPSILTESSIRWQTCPICWAPESETTPGNGILNLFYRSPIRVARSTVMIQIAALRSPCQKQPTDLRRSSRDLGGGALALCRFLREVAQ